MRRSRLRELGVRDVSAFDRDLDEFEVDDVPAAAAELQAAGYQLIHESRTEPWGQTIARVLDPNGLIVGVCFTPALRDR